MESIMSDLIPLFRPKSVALIGASSDTKKYGYWTAKSLIDNKFQGEIHLISRSGGEILGQPTYPDILSVPGEVDLAIIAIAPKHILSIIEQCVEKGVKTGIVVSTGFGETGPEGKEIERRMLEIARKGNMRIMGPNCMGMYSSAVSLNASIIDLAPGPMSLVLQSGNFGIDLNFNAKKRGMGYSCWATIGNQMDVRFNDFVRYIEQDDHTKVMLLYMEGLRVENEEDGRKFLEAARRTSVSKPIAAIKIGRSAAGARAAASHTGWMPTTPVRQWNDKQDRKCKTASRAVGCGGSLFQVQTRPRQAHSRPYRRRRARRYGDGLLRGQQPGSARAFRGHAGKAACHTQAALPHQEPRRPRGYARRRHVGVRSLSRGAS